MLFGGLPRAILRAVTDALLLWHFASWWVGASFGTPAPESRSKNWFFFVLLFVFCVFFCACFKKELIKQIANSINNVPAQAQG